MTRSRFHIVIIVFAIFVTTCKEKSEIAFKEPAVVTNKNDSIHIIDSNEIVEVFPEPVIYKQGQEINTGSTIPDSVVAFGKSLVGTPYLYASSDPAKGFDCSGFITYVFNQFGIAVPRSSVDFTDVGLEVPREFAAPR